MSYRAINSKTVKRHARESAARRRTRLTIADVMVGGYVDSGPPKHQRLMAQHARRTAKRKVFGL